MKGLGFNVGILLVVFGVFVVFVIGLGVVFVFLSGSSRYIRVVVIVGLLEF